MKTNILISKYKCHFSYLIILLVAFLVCLFRCGASPFINYYPVDSPVYITMGKAVKYGLTLYKDIGDHKGFYVYILNFFGSLISFTNFKYFSLFLIELVEIYITLLFGYKIINILSKDHYVNIISFIGLLCVYLYKGNFGKGNRPETFMLAFLMIGTYFLFKCLLIENNLQNANKFTINNTTSFIIGSVVAIIFNLKPNYVMVFSVILILYFFMFLDKHYTGIFKSILYAGLGFIIFMLPMIIYIFITSSVKDYIRWTLLYNFHYILKPHAFTFFNINFPKEFYNLYKHLYYFIRPENYVYIPVHILPILSLFCMKNFNFKFKISYIYMTIVALLIISMNGEKNMPYPIYLVPFTIIFIVTFVSKFILLFTHIHIISTIIIKKCLLFFTILFFIILNFYSIKNLQSYNVTDYEKEQIKYVLDYCDENNIPESKLKLFSDQWVYFLFSQTNIKIQKNNMFIPFFYDAVDGHIDYIKRYQNFLENDFDMLIVGSIDSYKNTTYDDVLLNELNAKFVNKLEANYFYTGAYGVYLPKR